MSHQTTQPSARDISRKSHDYIRVPWFVRSKVVIAIAVALLVTMGVLLALYWHNKEEKADGIEFTIKTLVGTVAIISLIVAFQSLVLKIYSDKVRASFEFLARFDRADEREARRKVNLLLQRTGSLAEFRNDPIPEERIFGFKATLTAEERDAATAFLAYVEDVALAIRTGFVQEAVLCRSVRPTLVRLLCALRPFVVITQLEEEDSSYFEEAMLLWEHWRDGRKLAAIGASDAQVAKSWMYLTYDRDDFGKRLTAVAATTI